MPTSERLMERMIHEAVQYLAESRVHRLSLGMLSERTGVGMETLQGLFADDDALTEAVGSFVAVQMTDALSRAIVAAPLGDGRAALIALTTAYVRWARENRDLYGLVSARLLKTEGGSWAFQRYETSFVPLIRQFLGETEENMTLGPALARSLIYGLTALVLDERLGPWLPPNSPTDEAVDAIIVDLADFLLSRPGRG